MGSAMRVQFKNIFCGTDFSDDSNHGIMSGIALAKEFGAKICVCHVIDLSAATICRENVSDPLAQPNRMIDHPIEYLKRLIGEQPEPFDWEPLVQIGRIGEEIVRMAEEKKVDLAFLATHGRSGLKRLLLGSVTEYLMRTLPCPLLIVLRPDHDFISPGKQEIRLNKILIECDFSPDSSLGFQYGLSLAQEFQSELHLVHVIQPCVYKDLLKRRIEFEEKRQQDLCDQLYIN
jgi:nucleotide-binding universal stress UspA family protein